MSEINRTPDFSELLNIVINNRLFNVHTAIPAIVQSFNATTGTVSVIPALKRKYNNGDVKELPIINDIPVNFPQSGSFILSFPLIKGDEVLLVFSERSIDSWKKSGGIIDPEDNRKFDLSDAFAFPIGRTLSIDASKMQLKYKDATISIDDNSKFFLGNSSQELLDLFQQLLSALEVAKTNTQIGPQPLINAATFTQIKTDLGAIKQ